MVFGAGRYVLRAESKKLIGHYSLPTQLSKLNSALLVYHTYEHRIVLSTSSTLLICGPLERDDRRYGVHEGIIAYIMAGS